MNHKEKHSKNHKVRKPGLNRRNKSGKKRGKESERVLRLLASVVSESVDAIIVQDMEGKIMAWNRGAERLYGYSESEAIGMNVSAIVPEDRRGEIMELAGKMKSGGHVDSVQTRRLTRTGSVIDVWLTITKLADKEGNVTGLATIERDITGHNRLLDEVESSLALAEEYSRDIEHLVAERTASLIALNIADRITNPAVVIQAMCRRILETNRLDDAGRLHFRAIQEESEKLQGIVRDFADFAARKQSFFSYEDLNMLVKEALSLIRTDAGKKGIKLITELSEKPLMINMNKHILRTAIFYIYKNALEATPRKGTISTSTYEHADNVLVIIADTGCGIAEENINRVFDNFFTTKVNGTGMGLSFVKYIMNEHFGDIQVESCKGSGTTCTLRFPARWLRFSRGQLAWERPMLPAVSERKEYPLEIVEDEPGPDEKNKL